MSKKQVHSKCREQHLSCVRIHVHVLPRGITTETYLMVYVDKSTFHLPFKIKASAECQGMY